MESVSLAERLHLVELRTSESRKQHAKRRQAHPSTILEAFPLIAFVVSPRYDAIFDI